MSDADSLIPATSGPARTMADDTLRLQLSVGKEHAQDAFRLFKARGTPMVLTPLGGEGEAIEAASASLQTMAGGNLRLFVDIEPRHAGAAFEHFGDQGASVALAALKTASQREREQRQRMETRGGGKAALAAQWCNDQQFWKWMIRTFTGDWQRIVDATPGLPASEAAANLIRALCGIQSRAELDHSAEAWGRFNERIRVPFMAWREQQP